MPPLHKHNRVQFLPSIPQTVTPKFRILPLPTAHRTLFFGSGESPADFQTVCFLWLLLLQNNYLLGTKKNQFLFLSAQNSWLSIGITYCLHFKEGKKNYQVPLALPLWSVYCFGYLLPHLLLVIAFLKRLTPLHQGISITTKNCRALNEAVTIIKRCILKQTLSSRHRRLRSVRGY